MGIADVNADDVWSEYGIDGNGIVVANIDTGVQYDHPALARQYRGNNGDGTFDHDYNWYDAQGGCPDAPCDPGGHGTHTMGTMVGDDGAGNQIGMAPGVSWMSTQPTAFTLAGCPAGGYRSWSARTATHRSPKRQSSGRGRRRLRTSP